MKFHRKFFDPMPGAQAKAPSNGIISANDILTSLTLVLCAIIALILPRALWSGASRRCARLHLAIKKPNLAVAEVLNAEGIEVSNFDLSHDLLSLNYLENIETMSEYLGYNSEPAVVVKGAANVARALESGRGVILWHSPFCCAALVEKRAYVCGGLSVTHLRASAHPFSSTAFGLRFLNPIKTRIENQYLKDVIMLVPRGERVALKQMRKALAENQVVSITAIGSGRNAIEVPFLGGILRLALGAPSLAYSTGAIVIPTATSIHPGPKYTVWFDAPLEIDSRLAKAEFRKALAFAYARRLAPHVRSRPGSWRGWIMANTWRGRLGPT